MHSAAWEAAGLSIEAVAGPQPGVPSCPEPPGAPSGGAGAELRPRHCQGGALTVLRDLALLAFKGVERRVLGPLDAPRRGVGPVRLRRVASRHRPVRLPHLLRHLGLAPICLLHHHACMAKGGEIGGGSLEHPRQWLGAHWPGPFPGSAEPVRAARCSLRRRGSGTAKGTLCHGGMPKALSAAVWNRMPTMTFLPATASDVLPVEASIARLLAPYCRTTRLSTLWVAGPRRKTLIATTPDSMGDNCGRARVDCDSFRLSLAPK